MKVIFLLVTNTFPMGKFAACSSWNNTLKYPQPQPAKIANIKSQISTNWTVCQFLPLDYANIIEVIITIRLFKLILVQETLFYCGVQVPIVEASENRDFYTTANPLKVNSGFDGSQWHGG